MFAFLWQEFPWSWKLFCCRLRWDIFHPTDSYFRRSALGLMEASWWHWWWVVTPNIGVINEMPPLGEQLINFLREILGLWIKTWRQNKVKCHTGFCIGFNYLALSLTWNDSELFTPFFSLQTWIFFSYFVLRINVCMVKFRAHNCWRWCHIFFIFNQILI